MKIRSMAAIAAIVSGSLLAASSASAEVLPPVNSDTPIEAPADDGTNGAFDVPGEETTTLLEPFAETVCDPSSTWYKVTSSTKSGKVTAWGLHVKNDSTSETFTFSSDTTSTFTASTTLSGSGSASVGLAKIADVTLGTSAEAGLEGQVATKSSTSRKVTFKTKGKWVIWSGVYTGSGTTGYYKCASNGQSSSRIGYTTGKTFNKARITGLTNCANSVSNRVEVDAKRKCG
ncbi:hypothetical protein [Krasilnikoviella flava]|uniref:Uncharacterized protein n=1 Tax=Krasilnikoviella flava TaxID=526729 RepID=A0A1T5M0L6_9MICO|nr:hypothetical protein [Krasilnikoviella flava]SKC81756.1 hypothetical protein SAMN04324258_4294 [Krasilnikoviella flava]